MNCFFNWFSTHFLPRKPSGKVLILLDGHTSHLSDPEILDFALQNDIELLCLPSHCTHYLQPLDRSFFKSLKVFFYQAANNWMKNKDRATISRLTFGRLLNESWIQSATIKIVFPDSTQRVFIRFALRQFPNTLLPYLIKYLYLVATQTKIKKFLRLRPHHQCKKHLRHLRQLQLTSVHHVKTLQPAVAHKKDPKKPLPLLKF